MLRAGHLIVVCTLALLVIGVVMVNSAGMAVAAKHPVTIQSVLLSRSTIYMAMALVALLATAWLAPVRLLANRVVPALGGDELSPFARSGWSLRLLWVGVGLLIVAMAVVYIPGFGDARKGAHRWVQLPIADLTFQPSELAKWLLILLLAWYAVTMGPTLRSFMRGLLPALAAIGAVAGFTVLEDLGTGVLLALVAVIVLLAGGARLWHFLIMIPPAAAAFVAAVVLQPYRLQRLVTFMDPYKEPDGSGYHMIQSMIAVANGQVFGRGLGHGLQKFGYLPEDTTDFVFAIVCEELGLIGASVVVLLYIALLVSGLFVVLKQKSLFLKLVGLGIISTVGIQAMINLAVVTGVGPTKGIALPLLSSGGTGWILTAAALGVLVAMDRLAEFDKTTATDAIGISVAPASTEQPPQAPLAVAVPA